MQLHLHPEAPLELVEDDLHVHLAGAGDEHLLGLWVEAQLHGRVFLAQAPQTVGDLLFVTPRLGSDGEGDGRRRELVARESGPGWAGSQRVSPVPVSFNLARATMSPAPASSMALVSLPCMSRMLPVRSFSPVRAFSS